MQMVLGASSLWYRRVITGAVLHALLVSAIAMPIAIGVTGLAIGPQPLRERIFITVDEFSVFHRGAGILLVMLATILLFMLLSLAVGRWSAYVRARGQTSLTARLFDDALTPREKLMVVVKSKWGCLGLALDLGWLGMAALAWN